MSGDSPTAWPPWASMAKSAVLRIHLLATLDADVRRGLGRRGRGPAQDGAGHAGGKGGKRDQKPGEAHGGPSLSSRQTPSILLISPPEVKRIAVPIPLVPALSATRVVMLYGGDGWLLA